MYKRQSKLVSWTERYLRCFNVVLCRDRGHSRRHVVDSRVLFSTFGMRFCAAEEIYGVGYEGRAKGWKFGAWK